MNLVGSLLAFLVQFEVDMRQSEEREVWSSCCCVRMINLGSEVKSQFLIIAEREGAENPSSEHWIEHSLELGFA